jgi:hypothetical protein
LRNLFFALDYALRILEPQNACGCLTDLANRLNRGARESEMCGLGFGAGIKKAGELAVSQDRPNIRTFLPIAENARPRQILQPGGASMFDADDVVNLEDKKAIILVGEAVLA